MIGAGCGGDEREGTPAPPAATESGETTGGEPGAPATGEPDYTGLGTWWRDLSRDERLASAAEFIADNPADCEGVEPVDLERQTGIAFGYDFPEATPTDAVMLETCALIRDGA
ncbi:MAG TPA: hypothetical protein VFY99_08705 [Solirubrobacterales bacterium]